MFRDDRTKPDVREDLRSELNSRYLLVGVPRLENGSNKFDRKHGFKLQGLT